MPATTIVGPSSGSSGGFEQLDQAFGRINNMFGNIGAPNVAQGGFGPAGISPQTIAGSDNSLTAYWRGLSNLQGEMAPQLIGAGGQFLGQGQNIVGAGLQTMQPAVNFYQQLLSGNPEASAQALGPQADLASKITAGAQTANAMQGARGGATNVNQTNLQDALVAQQRQAALGLAPAAAGALGQLGPEIAGIGQTQEQLGTVLTGQGLQTLQNTIADVLSKMGINIQGGTANLFSTVVGSL